MGLEWEKGLKEEEERKEGEREGDGGLSEEVDEIVEEEDKGKEEEEEEGEEGGRGGNGFGVGKVTNGVDISLFFFLALHFTLFLDEREGERGGAIIQFTFQRQGGQDRGQLGGHILLVANQWNHNIYSHS